MIKSSRTAPYALLFSLILVLIFIAGVRYGGDVEKTNKQIVSTTVTSPTQQEQMATPTPNTVYASKNINECGIEFLIPAGLVESKLSTSHDSENAVYATELHLENDPKPLIITSCVSKSLESRVKFSVNQDIISNWPSINPYEGIVEVPKSKNEVIHIDRIFNGYYLVNIERKGFPQVDMILDSSIYPLIESSLKLLPTPTDIPTVTPTP